MVSGLERCHTKRFVPFQALKALSRDEASRAGGFAESWSSELFFSRS